MNEHAVAALAEILAVSPGEARAVIKALRDRGFRVWAENVRPDVERRRVAQIDGQAAAP